MSTGGTGAPYGSDSSVDHERVPGRCPTQRCRVATRKRAEKPSCFGARGSVNVLAVRSVHRRCRRDRLRSGRSPRLRRWPDRRRAAAQPSCDNPEKRTGPRSEEQGPSSQPELAGCTTTVRAGRCTSSSDLDRSRHQQRHRLCGRLQPLRRPQGQCAGSHGRVRERRHRWWGGRGHQQEPRVSRSFRNRPGAAPDACVLGAFGRLPGVTQWTCS